jgi:hypothetical protein
MHTNRWVTSREETRCIREYLWNSMRVKMDIDLGNGGLVQVDVG